MLKKLITATLVLLLLLAPATSFAVPLDEFYGIVESQYIEPVDSRALRQITPAQLGEFLGDPYSVYYTPEEYSRFMDSYVSAAGVGIQIYLDGDEIVVMSVLPGTPAEKAGLLAGDVLVGVDGAAVAGLSLYEVVGMIRGEIGTSVTLVMRRGTQNIQFKLIRELLDIPTVFSESLGDIGYLYLNSFADSTAAQFRSSLADLLASNPRGYILDLRDNPGGLLDAVLEIGQDILPAGPVIIVRNRYGMEQAYGNFIDGEALPNLVVLVNEHSASAAEVLAGAIQDYRAGILLGERTFGKASIQTVFTLSDGSGLKLTTARYFTADRQAIDKTGLSPDVTVSGYENQLAAAIQMIRGTTNTLVFRIGSNDVWTTTAADITSDVQPFIENSRSYIPVRLLAETMGATVGWDPLTGVVTLEKDGTTLTIPTSEGEFLLNGTPYPMEKAILRDSRTFLPARAVANALGGRVWWNGNDKEVIVAW